VFPDNTWNLTCSQAASPERTFSIDELQRRLGQVSVHLYKLLVKQTPYCFFPQAGAALFFVRAQLTITIVEMTTTVFFGLNLP
jgi:hypothetical protein